MKTIRTGYQMVTLMLALIISRSVSAQNKALTDADIASITVTANQMDVKLAEIAKGKSRNREIVKYANLMLRDHQAFIDQTTALEKRLGFTQEDNVYSKKLVADADSMIMVLNSKTGPDFNRTYLDDEIRYHREVLTTVQSQLLPQVRNADLKAMLENDLPTRKSNLEDARTLKGILSR